MSGPVAPYRVLALDGGGAKGFYTLGVLREVEAMLAAPLYRHFDLIFGTSTGAIIATLIALGHSVDEIHEIYREHVPRVMSRRTRRGRTRELARLAKAIYGDKTFADTKTGIGVVAAKWLSERPMIFKGDIAQAHGSKGTFVPGFGVSMADAVQASCSAYPFFERKVVTTAAADEIELIDGCEFF
jgi:predicted acylesterase/phospholipase RssA